jgi:uncharacterized protein YukE
MYNTTADDLARVANDLSQIASKYTAGSQELDQHITALDGTASHLIYGGAMQWTGLASEAFQGAWEERRSRMQQASQLLTQAAQHLNQFAQTIENNLPTIRTDQQIMHEPINHMLAPDDQSSILNGESQAQNAILMALQALNSQLDALAEEVRDCPEEQDGNTPAWDDPYDNINRSDSNTGEEGGNKPNEGGSEGEASAIDDIFTDPYVLENMTPQEVKELAESEGWQTGTLGRGTHKGQGMVVREMDSNGNLTGKMIQWHPGEGHHGAEPYWKVSSPQTGTIRIGPQFPRPTP